MRNFTIAGLLGLVIITSILGYLYREHEINNLIALSANKGAALARVFNNVTWPEFSPHLQALSELDNPKLRQHAAVRQFDKLVRAQIQKLEIHRVSVLALNGNTVLSTSSSQLGVYQNTDPNFDKAKSGEVAAWLVHRDLVTSTEDIKLDRYVVVTLAPIHDPGDSNPAAVFKIHLDVTGFVSA
ncbi:MAG TPA: hypothetical protein VIM41_06245, partial [Gammaproteobacteria bacterium]